MDPPAEPTSAFFRTELSRALQECGFGILAWEVPDETASAQGISPHGTTPVEAIASVTLLSDEAEQGNTIEVHLNIRGYKVSKLGGEQCEGRPSVRARGAEGHLPAPCCCCCH